VSGDTSRTRKQAKATIARLIADAAELEGWVVAHRYREAVVLQDDNGDQYMITVVGMRATPGLQEWQP
jgi:hypothetical protein